MIIAVWECFWSAVVNTSKNSKYLPNLERGNLFGIASPAPLVIPSLNLSEKSIKNQNIFVSSILFLTNYDLQLKSLPQLPSIATTTPMRRSRRIFLTLKPWLLRAQYLILCCSMKIPWPKSWHIFFSPKAISYFQWVIFPFPSFYKPQSIMMENKFLVIWISAEHTAATLAVLVEHEMKRHIWIGLTYFWYSHNNKS